MQCLDAPDRLAAEARGPEPVQSLDAPNVHVRPGFRKVKQGKRAIRRSSHGLSTTAGAPLADQTACR